MIESTLPYWTLQRRVRAAAADRRRPTRSTAWGRRPGRSTAAAAPTRCGTPTCSARTRPRSSRARRTSADFDPYYVSIPFYYHHTADGQVSALVRRQRLPRALRVRRRDRLPLRGRPVHRVRVRRAADAGHPRGLHVAHRPRRAAAAVGARLPPVPLVRLHAGRGRGARRAPPRAAACRATRCGSTSSTWTATASSRGTRRSSRTPPGMLERLRAQGLPGDHDHRPGREVTSPATRSTTQAVERDVLCRTEGGDIYIGQVWPGDTAFPDFATRGGPRVVGRAQRRARRSPGSRGSGTT